MLSVRLSLLCLHQMSLIETLHLRVALELQGGGHCGRRARKVEEHRANTQGSHPPCGCDGFGDASSLVDIKKFVVCETSATFHR